MASARQHAGKVDRHVDDAVANVPRMIREMDDFHVCLRKITPGLLVVAAFIATVLFPWPSVAGILSWILLVSASLAWALQADPSWRGRVLQALSSKLPYRWRRA